MHDIGREAKAHLHEWAGSDNRELFAAAFREALSYCLIASSKQMHDDMSNLDWKIAALNRVVCNQLLPDYQAYTLLSLIKCERLREKLLSEFVQARGYDELDQVTIALETAPVLSKEETSCECSVALTRQTGTLMA